jgi:hypothetical protein
MSIIKVISVEPKMNYQLYVKYADGVEGIADLSGIAGKGVFSIWSKPGEFEKVYIDSKTGAIAWSDDLDICADSLHDEIKEKVNATN